MEPEELRRQVAGTVVVEIAWRAQDGSVQAAARTPLLYDAQAGTPTLALTYDDGPLASELASAESVLLVGSDPTLALAGWEPFSWRARPRVDADPEAETFIDELVEQELRKHPPSRLRADSLLQRREYWWYIARLLVRLERVQPLAPPAPRADPDHGVVVWDASDGLRADTVAVDDWLAERIRLRGLGPAGSDPRGPGPGALLRHEYSDDFERRAELLLTGRIDGDVFDVAHRHGVARLPGIPSWWQRLRAAKRWERACRRAIAAAGH